MSNLTVNKSSAKRSNAADNNDGRRDGPGASPRRRGDILGLRAFEKISAVEGIRLTDEMRKDLKSLGAQPEDEGERSRFILAKYGKR